MIKIAIVGGGHMGGAFAKALLAKQTVEPEALLIVEKSPERRKELETQYGCSVNSEFSSELGEAAAVVLAVKPQNAAETCGALSGFLSLDCLVLSIMAGISLELLRGWFPKAPLIRAMPNMPAQIAKGVTAYTTDSAVSSEQRLLAETILSSTGSCFRVESENLIDAATAISGSGPAYIFYLIEHYLAEARSLGLSSNDAAEMVAETISGAVALWRESGLEPGKLRDMVTSKGGTTAAALAVFEERGIGSAFSEGIRAAYRRAESLGKK